MDALKQAKADMGYYEEWADNSPVVPSPELLIGSAQAYAAIEQAEQLKRIADASERQATAVERRNELLEEYNKVSHEQHTIYRSE